MNTRDEVLNSGTLQVSGGANYQGRARNEETTVGELQILRLQTGVLGNSREHPRPDLITIVEGKDYVCPPRSLERAV